MKLFSIFNKNPDQIKENLYAQNKFKITEAKRPDIEFVVSEISFEEYENAFTKERRMKPRSTLEENYSNDLWETMRHIPQKKKKYEN